MLSILLSVETLFSFGVVIQTTPAFLGTFLATPQSPAQPLLVTLVILGVLSLAAFPARVLSHFSHVRLFATPWTVACQASLSMGFPRQKYWSGLPFPTSGNLPNPGPEPMSLVSFTTAPLGKPN